MVHGGASSMGCIALGDVAIEELFTLTADVGRERVRVLISPFDLRGSRAIGAAADERPWVRRLYTRRRTSLRELERR